MVDAKEIALFIGVTLPSLLLLIVSVDAPLVVGQDVFLFALLQVLFVGAFMYKY